MSRPLRRLRLLEDYTSWGARAFERAGLHFGHGTDNAADDSFHLALSVLGWSPKHIQHHRSRVLSPAQGAKVLAAFRSRIKTRKPVAYLTGKAWFSGLRFTVDETVLIPRSPIAELIVDRFRPWLKQSPRSVLDLCAGSGCIGIVCAKSFQDARVDLAEIDVGALRVCNLNVRRYRLGRRVQAIQSDLFSALENRRYDLIVSNPPYVPTVEWKNLPAEYRHEPRLALEAGRDGMDIVARILETAADHLNPGGTLVCEIGGSVPQFIKRFPRFPALWPEFEQGGDGVFIISREELRRWQRKRK